MQLPRQLAFLFAASLAVFTPPDNACTQAAAMHDGIVAASDRLQVETELPGGAADVESIDQTKREIRLSPPRDPRRGFEAWWYFKVTGVRPGEEITLRVTGGTPRDLMTWAWMKQAVFSTDGENWRHTAPGQRVAQGEANGIPHMLYRQKIDANVAWFAYALPYLPHHARELIRKTEQASLHAKSFELARTRLDYPVPALRIAEPGAPESERLGIWIQARQHAFESGASWVCHGFAEWLVSDDPTAQALRQKAEITMVPIMDVDSVVRGAGGKMQQPQDHNRDWSDKPHWESVASAQREIKRLTAAGRFDIFIDIHGPGRAAPFFFVNPPDSHPEPQRSNLKNFLAAFPAPPWQPERAQEYSSAKFYSVERNVFGSTSSRSWVTKNTTPHVVVGGLEVAMDTPLSDRAGYFAQGRELGRAIARYLPKHVRTDAQAVGGAVK